MVFAEPLTVSCLVLAARRWHTALMPAFHTASARRYSSTFMSLRSYVDLDAIRSKRKEFGRMLLYEAADARNAESLATLGSVDFAQHSVRIGKGNPVDGQFGAIRGRSGSLCD